MAETNLKWYDASVAFPVFSGMYMVLTKDGLMTSMFFSSVNHCFNASDTMPAATAEKFKVDIVAWSEIEEQVESLESSFDWELKDCFFVN